jgi:hypothetical protein
MMENLKEIPYKNLFTFRLDNFPGKMGKMQNIF